MNSGKKKYTHSLFVFYLNFFTLLWVSIHRCCLVFVLFSFFFSLSAPVASSPQSNVSYSTKAKKTFSAAETRRSAEQLFKNSRVTKQKSKQKKINTPIVRQRTRSNSNSLPHEPAAQGNYSDIYDQEEMLTTEGDAVQVISDKSVKLTRGQVWAIRVSTPLLQAFATLNSLSFIGRDNLTNNDALLGILKYLGTQASIGIMFADSYQATISKLFKKSNASKAETGSRCSCADCCSGGVKKTCQRAAWIIIPPIVGLASCFTDALNTQNGVLKILTKFQVEALLAHVLSNVAFGLNFLSESFLYTMGCRKLWQGYTTMFRNVRHGKLPDANHIKDLLQKMKSFNSEAESPEAVDLTEEQAEYLSQALENPERYLELMRLEKAFQENSFETAYTSEQRWSKAQSVGHIALNTVLIASIATYLSAGMAAPTTLAALTAGTELKAVIGFAAYISYILQSISLSPMVMDTFYTILTPVIMFSLYSLKGLWNKDSTELKHYCEALKAQLPNNFAKVTAVILAGVGTASYIWAYSGLQPVIQNIRNYMPQASWPAITSTLHGIYQGIPGSSYLATTIGQLTVFGVMFIPSFRIWPRIFHNARNFCSCRKSDEDNKSDVQSSHSKDVEMALMGSN